jgi:membrane associated rhomboid family serine protease
MSFSASLYSSRSDGSRITPAVRWLLALNIGVYFLQVALFGEQNVFSALALDARDFPDTWWTAVSYMFVHANLWHLALNMLTLWMFGPRVEEEWSTRGFLSFYLWCGLGGALTHLLLVAGSGLIGASAAVSGVMLAYAIRWPDEEVYLFGVIPMKSRWLVAWMVIINLAMGISSNGSGIGWFAHLGGLGFGWLYLRISSFGGLDQVRRWVSPVPDEGDDPPRAVPRVKPRSRARGEMIDEVVAESHAVTQRPVVQTGSAETRPRAEQIDRLLDKISQAGIGSLTADERKLLEEMSRRLRGKD